jgi:hypothetical protein
MGDMLQKQGKMTGTGGMVSPQRVPMEWMKEKLPMTKESPQGPEVTSKPTMRSLATGAESRALAPIPGDVVSALQVGDQGGFLAGVLASRPSAATRTAPGDDGNLSIGAQGEEKIAKGSASRTTGIPVKGETMGKGMI